MVTRERERLSQRTKMLLRYLMPELKRAGVSVLHLPFCREEASGYRSCAKPSQAPCGSLPRPASSALCRRPSGSGLPLASSESHASLPSLTPALGLLPLSS